MVRNGWLAEYYLRPDATGKSLHDGFFSVGDVAYRDAEGYYYICDRQVDMVISGGVNIYPAEVEAALHAHPAVMDAAVFGVPDEQWGESVKGVVQLRPGLSATADELIAFCDERLAGYKKPRARSRCHVRAPGVQAWRRRRSAARNGFARRRAPGPREDPPRP